MTALALKHYGIFEICAMAFAAYKVAVIRVYRIIGVQQCIKVRALFWTRLGGAAGESTSGVICIDKGIAVIIYTVRTCWVIYVSFPVAGEAQRIIVITVSRTEGCSVSILVSV